jgi:hypothetical protein
MYIETKVIASKIHVECGKRIHVWDVLMGFEIEMNMIQSHGEIFRRLFITWLN